MKKELLLGAEAIALGALDGGISGVYAYPGTPSTEITEYIQKNSHQRKEPVRSAWSANEKTAYEAALGMSYAGKRSLVCMKHVGLNVAADAFINSAITGVNGGLVVAVADDPSMHSSQNEQDSRVYGKFAMLPVFEPASQQELYDATREAFDLSESIRLPVLLRLTTRLAHSRAGVEKREVRQQNRLNAIHAPERFVLMPHNARRQYNHLLGIQNKLEAYSEQSWLNRLIPGTGSTGVLAFGIAFNYVMEVRQAYGMEFPILKIGCYPMPRKAIEDLFSRCETVLVAEEGYPVYEELLRGYFGGKNIRGRLDGALPRAGELNADSVARALGIAPKELMPVPDIVANRPPALCKGCGHRDLYEALNTVMSTCSDRHVFSDIGCYTLGALPPFNSISTCVDMGASITMAKGAADAGLRPAVAVIGDSTFTHSGMTGLLDAVNNQAPITVIIADNDTTAMTGGQSSSATGSKLHAICRGIGVDEEHIRTIIPLKSQLEENIAILREEIAWDGVSVVLAYRECIEAAARKKRNRKGTP
ncbi:indolepyruvate ferredoxin oxidoreductase [Chlorobium sp. BLA1]|uniref:thiamine pyrophosphate-dependent enzyme n=1 Tax=Candidatus Chlorobium masyuteum TaxID=2716876 RepID=UPI00141FA6D8|nr:thiamine pyrophosphate-dependent enzyme [Candidatus Chlorobium masyuteum]NHQ59578.1 indolepyruvate ferredoxin oxidoreductase [Candidatus Chlorobium masyuteum]